MVHTYNFVSKKQLYRFLKFFAVGNTFHTNIIEIFYLGLAEQFNTKIPLFFIIIQDFIRPFFDEIKFKPRFKDPPTGLRQFLTIESSLKMMKNTVYFMLKALFVLEKFTFLS